MLPARFPACTGRRSCFYRPAEKTSVGEEDEAIVEVERVAEIMAKNRQNRLSGNKLRLEFSAGRRGKLTPVVEWTIDRQRESPGSGAWDRFLDCGNRREMIGLDRKRRVERRSR